MGRFRRSKQEKAVQAAPTPARDAPRYVIPNITTITPPESLSGVSIRCRSSSSGSITPLSKGHLYFDVVAGSACFAVDLLNSRRGAQALQLGGEAIVEEFGLRDHNSRCRPPQHMGNFVADFLRRIKDCLPVVLVTDLKGMNGRTTKAAWEMPLNRVFPPHHSGVIELNIRLVNMLANARHDFMTSPSDSTRDRFHALLFRIGVTIAHELVHIFTGYLLFDPRKNTPPKVTYGGYGHQRVGESGRYWEARMFGGFVDMRQSSSGLCGIAVRDNLNRTAWHIHPAVLRQMIERNFSFLPVTDTELVSKSYEPARMEVRIWKNRFGDIFPAFRDEYVPRLNARELDALTDGRAIWSTLSADTLRCWAKDHRVAVTGTEGFSVTLKETA